MIFNYKKKCVDYFKKYGILIKESFKDIQFCSRTMTVTYHCIDYKTIFKNKEHILENVNWCFNEIIMERLESE